MALLSNFQVEVEENMNLLTAAVGRLTDCGEDKGLRGDANAILAEMKSLASLLCSQRYVMSVGSKIHYIYSSGKMCLVAVVWTLKQCPS